jgi:hypothetical protein
MRERAEFLVDYAEQHGPVTVRGLYYQAEVRGVPGIDKTEASYDKVQRQVLLLRRAGRMPYENIADLTRWTRKPRSYNGVEAALRSTAQFYRKALWADADSYLEIWCEKDALAGVIHPVTAEYDVPLMVCRGFSSETFAFEAIEAREDDPRDYVIWYLGDFDRSGRDAADSLMEKITRFADEKGVDVSFNILAIEEQDVLEFDTSDMTALVNLNGGPAGCLRARISASHLPTKHGRTPMQSSLTRSNQTTCGEWCARSSSMSCRPTNSRSCGQPRRASVR